MSRFGIGGAMVCMICICMACDDYDEFREDVVLCEEAVAHLTECCGEALPRKPRCTYFYDDNGGGPRNSESCYGLGCGCNASREVHPDLNEDTSRCILDQSCGVLRQLCTDDAVGGAGICQ